MTYQPTAIYPIRSIQHTRAPFAALAAVDVCRVFEFALRGQNDLHALAVTCSDLVKNCLKDVSGAPRHGFSAGAKRELDVRTNYLQTCMQQANKAEGEERFIQWAALLYAAGILVCGAVATCPAFTGRSCWKRLDASLEQLFTAMVEDAANGPEAVLGTQIYLAAA